MNKTGKCMCGAVSFEIRDVQTEFGCCHCEMCQRWAGSALLGFTVPQDTVTFEGIENVATLQSSDWAERSWCSKCGSGLWYRETATGTYHMPVGLLDDQTGMKLVTEIFSDCRSPAFSFANDTKKVTRAEIIARAQAANEE